MAVCMLCMGCKKNNQICGPDAHLENDTCLCNTGWVGADCSVPVSKFVGTYHVVGDWYSHLYVDPWTTNSGHIDTVMEVTLRHDTLYAKNWPYTFGLGNYDTSKYYRFGWLFGNYDYGYLYFHKVPDDTLIYTTYFGGMGGGTTTNLVGVKLQ